MPDDARRDEISRLATRLNEMYTDERVPRDELAEAVNEHLTEYMASITGQRVHTSSEVREFTFAKLIFPFAMGSLRHHLGGRRPVQRHRRFRKRT